MTRKNSSKLSFQTQPEDPKDTLQLENDLLKQENALLKEQLAAVNEQNKYLLEEAAKDLATITEKMERHM